MIYIVIIIIIIIVLFNIIIQCGKYLYVKRWLKKEEPLQRKALGYPIDWKIRREIRIKESIGICVSCGQKINNNVHIHHIKPLSKGGDHSLSNLEVLCENCHFNKHPRIKNAFERKRVLEKLGLLKNARIVMKSTVDWDCAICKKKITKGDSYYGNYHNKLCIECAPLRIKKYLNPKKGS